MINTKAIGGTLLVVGTSIGAGMLALPFALAKVGFFYGVCFFVLCWFVMYLGACLILEVNLKFAPGSHMVTMAKKSLGWPGQISAWVVCLGLLYTLLAGYISGGRDILGGLLKQSSLNCPDAVCTILFTACFGLIVYAGIRTVDYVNRVLMFGKLGVYFFVVLLLVPYLHVSELIGGDLQSVPGNIMILITSFGFASIVPSLRYYFQEDVVTLRRVILWGSLIPLACYIGWLAVIMSIVPRAQLVTLSQSVNPIAGLMQLLDVRFGVGWIAGLFSLFTVICMLTAFLGVSLGLFDFLADSLHLKKRGKEGLIVFAVTFLPPMIVVLVNPGIYMAALKYAGFCCVMLLLILPAMMAWREKIQLKGGKVGIGFVMLAAVGLLYIGS